MAPRLIVSILAVATLSVVSSAQTSKPAEPIAWPKPTAQQASQTKLALRKLGDEDQAVVAAAVDDLVAIGPACVTAAVRQLGGRNETVRPHICAVLDRVLLPEHAPLIAKWVEKGKLPVRRYATRRLARFHLPQTEPVFRAALKAKKPDPEVVFLASLGLAGLGIWDEFDTVFTRCVDDWRSVADLVDEVLAKQRSPESAKRLLGRMQTEDEEHLVTGLRLMRSLCPKTRAGMIGVWLDSSSNRVKRATINALRAIVDGDEPIENLSAFQAIEHAKKWKARI